MKSGAANFNKFIIYLVLIILVNIAGITLFFRIDLTKNKIYSISKASQEVVATLSEPLTIKVFFTKNLPAPYNNTERYLHDLLEEYAVYANKNFNYSFYDVSPDEGDINDKTRANQEVANNYGIYPVQIQAIEKDEVKFKKAYMGLALIQGEIIERIPTIDSTERLEYRLTKAVQKLNNKISALLGIKDNIQVKLYLSSSINAVAPYMHIEQLEDIPGKIEEIVKKVNDKNFGKLSYEYLDPSKDEKLKDELKKYNVMDLNWPVLSDGNIPAGSGSIGLVMTHKGKFVTTPLLHVMSIPGFGTSYELANLNTMEDIINDNIESLIDINRGIGYLVDHKTLPIAGTMMSDPTGQHKYDIATNFKKILVENYSLKPVRLKDDTLPTSLKCLLIAGPVEPFTDYELFEIDQFLMKGNSLALFLDPFREMPQADQQVMGDTGGEPIYVPIDTKLEKLLEHYGISTKKSYVMDENCYSQNIPSQYGGGARPIYFAPIIKNKFINSSLNFMNNIKELITLKIAPVEPVKKIIEKNNLTVKKLFSSSENSWEMQGNINLNPDLIRPPDSADKKKSIPLAYIVEGEFSSYFAGKPLPLKEKSGKDTEKKESKETEKENQKSDSEISKIKSRVEIITKSKPAKIFITGTSEVLKNNILDRLGSNSNAIFVMNVLDYLNDREDIAVMRSKEQRFNPLYETKGSTRTFVKFFNIAGLPVLIVLFGIFVLFFRHSRKRRIEIMFSKERKV